ncbi:HTH_Tnp_Tc3_2 domain-containing protein [Trichonephila clavipes]|nr:HTH_Tnp_Tc3_2 domain-containing protein [Trichonephila clavipes]
MLVRMGGQSTSQSHDASGRPWAITDREDRLIVRLAVTVPDSSLSAIRCATRTRVSIMTIHRRIDRAKFALILTTTPPAHCRARLQRCLALSGWNHAEWESIVFSEEFRFQMCPDDRRRRVWRRPGQRADPAFTIAHHTDP